MASAELPRRGEVWLVTLGAGGSGEPGRTRPAVVVSVDELAPVAPDDLVVVVPLSSSAAPSLLRIEVGEAAGVDRASRAICRAVHAVVIGRCERRVGRVDDPVLRQIEAALAAVLGLDRTRP